MPTPERTIMQNDYREKHRRNYHVMRTVYNITMGCVILGIGIVLLFSDRLGLDLFESYDKTVIYSFSGLCILYGGFRLYRGIKKDY